MSINKNLVLTEVKDYTFITIGLIVFAFAYTIFLLPYEIVTGGVTGFSALIYYITDFQIKIEDTYMLINIALLVVALKILGWKFLMKTIYAIIMLYVLLKFAQWIYPKAPNGLPIKLLGEGQDFMSVIIGCCITGTSLAMVFFYNGSTGGTDIIAACVNKYRNWSLGQVLILIDFLIVGSCMFFPQFGTLIERAHKVVFGLSTIAIECFMLDFVFNRQRGSVQFLIFSKKYQEISFKLAMDLDLGVTLLDGHGWYSGQEMKVICVLAKKNRSTQIFRVIKSIDPNAFVSQSSVIGVYGEGFDNIKVSVKKKKEKK